MGIFTETGSRVPAPARRRGHVSDSDAPGAGAAAPYCRGRPAGRMSAPVSGTRRWSPSPKNSKASTSRRVTKSSPSRRTRSPTSSSAPKSPACSMTCSRAGALPRRDAADGRRDGGGHRPAGQLRLRPRVLDRYDDARARPEGHEGRDVPRWRRQFREHARECREKLDKFGFRRPLELQCIDLNEGILLRL